MAANDVPCCETMFWVYLLICVALVLFAGLMSGLTLGLMSLSLVDLEILSKAGHPHEQKNAAKILPIVKNQHLLLCTLLIGNSLAMEALPIFIDALLPAWGAILISVTLILAFGEIIPQAVCSRYGLSVGAKLSILVRFIVIILFPLAYPISKLLDLLLGKRHSALLRRAELKTLVDMHANEAGNGGELTHDETTIIAGALDMTQKTAKDAMTPLSKIFSLDINAKLDEETMGLIIRKGHSRVPIYSRSEANIIGLILVKNLIKCRPGDETTIRDLNIRSIPRVHDHLPLYDILNQFQKGHSHMAVVIKSKNEVEATDTAQSKSWTVDVDSHSNCNGKQNGSKGNTHDVSCLSNQTPISKKWEQLDAIETRVNLDCRPASDEEVLGIITLEDVMEELLQEEIWDETDEYVDVHNSLRINMQPSRGSPFRSPGRAISSPGSAGSQTSTRRSPISRYSQSPKLSASPMPKSPLSGSTQQVSSTWYEKLEKKQDP